MPAAVLPEAPAVTSISLSELIEKHRQEHIRANAWSTSTQNDYKSIGKVLVQMLGDVPIHTLGFEEFRLYKEALQGMPPRFVSTPQYEGMDAKDVIALNLPSDKTISSKSISKNFAYVKSPVDVKQVVAYFELTVVFHHLLILSKRPQLSPPFFNSVRREVKQRIGSP